MFLASTCERFTRSTKFELKFEKGLGEMHTSDTSPLTPIGKCGVYVAAKKHPTPMLSGPRQRASPRQRRWQRRRRSGELGVPRKTRSSIRRWKRRNWPLRRRWPPSTSSEESRPLLNHCRNSESALRDHVREFGRRRCLRQP